MASRILGSLFAGFFFLMAALALYSESFIAGGKRGRTLNVEQADSPIFFWSMIALHCLLGTGILLVVFKSRKPAQP